MQFTALPEDTIDNAKVFFFIANKSKFNTRSAVLDFFTCRQREVVNVPESCRGAKIIGIELTESEKLVFSDILVCHVPKTVSKLEDFTLTDATDDYIPYGIYNPHTSNKLFMIKLADTANGRLYEFNHRFYIHPGDIDNYNEEQPLLTDVGKFYLNQLLLVMPFKDIIPYWNTRFDVGKLDKTVAAGIMAGKIDRSMYEKYIDHGYWFGDGAIFAPGWSEKSLTTDPAILKRKEELLNQYRSQLDDPIVLAKIEKELVDMDKAYIKGDSSETFYLAMGENSFADQRKKLFITFGLAASFGDTSGKYNFVEESLSEGWTPASFTACANNLRGGAYSRGVETAKGGEQTKFILRIFQEVTITEDDCGSKRGISVIITDNNKNDYIDRWTVDGKLLTKEILQDSVGKTFVIRSPQYCHTHNGYCFKCCGDVYRQINNRSIGLDSILITSAFTTTAMKKVHVSSIKATSIKNFFDMVKFSKIKKDKET